MKKSLHILLACFFALSIHAQVPPLSFTVTNNTGLSTISCNNPSISLSASSNYSSSVSYVWIHPSTTLSGPNVTITTPGVYTVYAVAIDSATSSQTLVIGQDTLLPSSTVGPISQTITCNPSSVITITASVSSSNVTQYILAPQGGTFTSNNMNVNYSPVATGSFTHIAINNLNGCQTVKTFTIVSAQAFPTFSVVSPQSFTLGCNTKSVAVIAIINGSSSSPPGGPVSYTVLPPGSPTATPIGTLSAISVYTVNTPGTWVVITRDNNNLCETMIPISVLQNTFAPSISVNVPTQILNCNIPQVQLQGSSTTPNVAYAWTFPSTPGILISSSISINSVPAIPTLTLVANYTLTITETNNACTSVSVVPVYQNLFPPNAQIADGGNNVLSCQAQTIALTNTSFSGIPPSTGFPTNLPVVGLEWHGPAPQASLALSTTYIAYTAGTYTMIARDMNNGCIAVDTHVLTGNGSGCVGIGEQKGQEYAVSCFPNPTSGLLVVEIPGSQKNMTVNVYNSLGRLIKKQETATDKTPIDLQDQPDGVYLVQIVENNKAVYITRILKR